METIIYTAKPLSRKRYRLFKRIRKIGKKVIHITGEIYKDGVYEVVGIEKEYIYYSTPRDTGIVTKNPKAVIFSLAKKDEGERKLKKIQNNA
jgi:hypothetical protein